MDKVYQAIDWMKANPLLVVCIVIILGSIGLFAYSQMMLSEQVEKYEARSSAVAEIERFYNTTVEAPGPEPDDPPLELRMVANEGAIEQLETIYNQLEREYRGIFDSATQVNQQGHEPMLEGLFPTPTSQAKRFRAATPYIESFEELYAELDAGTPPTQAELNDVVQQERDVMLRQLPPSDEELTEEQQEELLERQKQQLFRFVREHATNFRIFADPVSLDVRGEWNPGPFSVGEWPLGTPSMADLWHGQMDLWIQQDLVRAINVANAPSETASVLTLPIKRLLSITTIPGYIGAEDKALGEVTESSVQEAISTLEQESSQRLPQDFSVSPTGRISNALYDVRHVEMSLIVDAQQIPTVLNAVGNVNFMTVIGMEISNIDEYQHLRDGYYYGKADSVQLDLVIETIWLRSWTAGHLSAEHAEELGEEFSAGLMPDTVRVSLGLPPRNVEEFTASASR